MAATLVTLNPVPANNLSSAAADVRQAVATANVVLAAVDPTVNDDSGDGIPVGMRWHNTVASTVWEAMDVTVGAAVWVNLTAAGGAGLGDPGSNGVVVRTALNTTVARTLVGTSPVVMTDGSGVAGAPTVSFDQTVALGNNARVAVSKNSGATVGTRRRLNLIEGTGITLTVADDAGNEEVDATVAVASTLINGCAAVVDFGSTANCSAKVTVTGQAWVNASSRIIVGPGGTHADHPTAEDAAVEGITAVATNYVNGVGFDVIAASPGGSRGSYPFQCVGV